MHVFLFVYLGCCFRVSAKRPRVHVRAAKDSDEHTPRTLAVSENPPPPTTSTHTHTRAMATTAGNGDDEFNFPKYTHEQHFYRDFINILVFVQTKCKRGVRFFVCVFVFGQHQANSKRCRRHRRDLGVCQERKRRRKKQLKLSSPIKPEHALSLIETRQHLKETIMAI